MIKVLHVSTECYPAAKAGGMGDVVGSLPIYLPEAGADATVIIPKYKNKWFEDKSFSEVFSGHFNMAGEPIAFSILKLDDGHLQFPFYCVDIPGKYDRPNIYLNEYGHAFHDEAQRYISFQRAVCDWLNEDPQRFDIIHCHDHMTGLIIFFLKFCDDYKALSEKPTVFTIHNGQYRGTFNWGTEYLFPQYNHGVNGTLDWDGQIHSLATAIKIAWSVTTVSPNYMDELKRDFDNLTGLINHESAKSTGILNGIDSVLWDPARDKYLDQHLEDGKWKLFKAHHKKQLLNKYKLKSRRPLISFIGRFAYEKGADLLGDSFETILKLGHKVNFMILGSGDPGIENRVRALGEKYPDSVGVEIAYNEGLARMIYAGSDFLVMPSRFEPCGLNQMFSMRYGTIPVVRSTGGLKDTVPDIGDGGNGISFNNASHDDIVMAITRSIELYKDKKSFNRLIEKITQLDFSWHQSAQQYSKLYTSLTK